MGYEERKKRLNELWISLLNNGVVSNKKELAEQIGISYSTICNAFGSHQPSLTDSLLNKVELLAQSHGINQKSPDQKVGTVDKLLDEISAQRKLTETALEQNGKLLTIIENLTKK